MNTANEKYNLSDDIAKFSMLTKIPTEILLSILEKMNKHKEVNKNGSRLYVAKYKFEGAGDLTDLRNKNVKRLEEVFDEIIDTQLESFYGDGYLYKKVNLFERYSFRSDSTVEIFLTPDSLINRLMDGEECSILELNEFNKLETKYSREFYRIFRQFRHSGRVSIKKKEMFELLEFPCESKIDDENDLNFIDEALIPSFEELSKLFENLSFENLEMSGTGEMPEICEFSFKKHKKLNLKKAFKERKNYEVEIFKHILNN